MKQAIRDWTGWILGWVEEDSQGNKTATNFQGQILGYYKKGMNCTTDFYGRRLYDGDCAVSLVTDYAAQHGDGKNGRYR